MPIYEYRCSSCSFELEKLQRISEARLTDCPECGKPALRRVISAAGFRLKGSGWYETDFKKGTKRNVSEASADGDSKIAKKDESKAADSGKPDKAAASDKSGTAESNKSSAA